MRGVELIVAPGEVHGLVGENGAGKSTLINIASGLLRPDAGSVLVEGQTTVFSGPRHAAALGITVVHQEADLFPQLSIAENMLLSEGLVRGPARLIDWRGTYRKAQEEVERFGESFNVRALAGGLPVARRMMAEIAAAVSQDARVLFLDEPTSALTLKEIRQLFEWIERLRVQGVGIVYVSHRLEEVLEICDRVTVLRDGELVAVEPAKVLTIDRLVSMMVGREVESVRATADQEPGPVRLRVEGATDAREAFREVSLEVKAGEVVGLYGFVGAGRSELGQALFGVRRLSSGQVKVDGRRCAPRSPREAMRAGLAYVPEDRLVQGVFAGHSVERNASTAMLRRLSVLGWIRRGQERRLMERMVEEMQIRAASVKQPITSLSGGNQQKVVFGRWLATDPGVLVLDEPTRGVDVGAKAEIHKLIGKLAEAGAGVLLISSELPEIMSLSARVVTLSEGRKTGEFVPAKDGEEAIAAAAVPRSGEGAGASCGSEAGLVWRLLQFRELGLLGCIFVLCGVMAVVRPGAFMTAENLLDVMASAAIPAMMAQGAMLIICAGGIDISVGSMMALAGALAGMAANAGYPAGVCLAMAIGLGIGMSLLNAGVALLARIHPIVVTLAGISIYRGVMRMVTGGDEVLQLPAAYRALAEGRIWGVPKLCWYVVGITVLSHLLLRYTILGRRILAQGDSERAARLIGLSKVRLTLWVFGFSGALVGLCSVLHAGYYAKVEAGMGSGMELRAIAAAVIGGTNILGGRGSAVGTFLGAFLIALLPNVLVFAQSSDYWQNLFVGGLILAAVVMDAVVQRLGRARA